MPKNNLGVKCMSDAVYVKSLIDNNSYCKSNGQFTKHLQKHGMTYQEYYEKYISFQSPKCLCGASLTFYQKTESYAKSCGNPKCVGVNVSKTKQAWTVEQRLEDSNNKKSAAKLRTPDSIATKIAKSKETFRQKYGVDWATKSTEFKNKSKQTKLTRYGNEYYSNSKKTSESWPPRPRVINDPLAHQLSSPCLILCRL